MTNHAATSIYDEGSTLGLTFPDMPGCYIAADDWDGILVAVTESLDLWFEDMSDVQPADRDVLSNPADVAEGVARGATRIVAPYLPADPALERVNISME